MSTQRILAKVELRSDAVLTTSYVAASQLDVSGCEGVTIFVKYTLGSLTSVEVKVETSPDDSDTAAGSSDWAQSTALDGTLREYTRSDASGVIPIQIPENGAVLSSLKVRAQVKGTGTVTNSLCEVVAVRRVSP